MEQARLWQGLWRVTLRVLKPESVWKAQYGDIHVLGLME